MEGRDDLEQQIDLVTQQLAIKFDQVPGEKVLAAVQEAEAGLRSARIRDYVPVLVEKQARDWLSAEVGVACRDQMAS